MKNKLIWITIIFLFIGIIIILGDYLNWFVDKEKIFFYKTISSSYGCSINTTGADKFLSKFFYKKDRIKLGFIGPMCIEVLKTDLNVAVETIGIVM